MTSFAHTAMEATSSSPDVPPGWRITWPFPGVYPPGYTPSYSFIFSGPLYVKWDDTASTINSMIQDQVSWKTKQPDGDITWYAVIDGGDSVEIRLDGESTWNDSLTRSFQQDGSDNYYDEATFEFNLSSGDVGEKLHVYTSCQMDGETVSSYHEIEITNDFVWEVLFTVEFNGTGTSQPPQPDEYTYGCRQYLHNTTGLFDVPWGYTYSNYLYQWNGSPTWNFDEGAWTLSDMGVYVPVDDGSPWILGTVPYGEARIKALQITDGITYVASHRHDRTLIPTANMTYDYTFKLYKNGELQTTKTKQVTKSNGDPIDSVVDWLSLNGTTKQITILNP
jgi:hypothetical protein